MSDLNKIRLFCFPYAGGSSAMFSEWKTLLHPSVDMQAVELAGRGKRIGDPLYQDVPEMIEDLLQRIEAGITDLPYALFGHSLGSTICYELYKKIREKGLPLPVHLFFSGSGALHVIRADEKIYHLMSDAEFKKEVFELGGTPPEFFEYPELLQMFLPMLKNDFRMAEQGPVGELIPIEGDITVFLGKKDDLTPEQCDGWKLYTRQVCRMYYFEGGHFFLQNQGPAIVSVINQTLLEHKPYRQLQ
jgi:surfactin synthase thioesterase subunit